MTSATHGNKLLIATTLAGIAVLIALGSWQLQRLAWKQQLISYRQQAISADPVSLTDIEAGIEHGYDVNLLRAKATGYYRHDLERFVYYLRGGKIGWRVVTPFVAPGRFIILVDRGFVPDNRKAQSTRPQSVALSSLTPQIKLNDEVDWPQAAEITGYVRVHANSAGIFTPANDPDANRWFSYDLAAMSATLPDDVGFKSPDSYAAMLPVYLQLEPGGEPAEKKLPIIDPLDTKLTNNHLHYAITWYCLAGILAAISFLFIRSRRQTTGH